MRRTLKIGSDVPPIFLAPMAGYTDFAYRKICFELGLSFAVTEMVSAKALSYGDEKTESISKSESRTGIQLFGHDISALQIAVEKLNVRNDFLWYDLNFGCPAPKIIKNHDGSSLLSDLPTLRKVIECVKKYSNKPVSAKMRLGFKDGDDYLEIAKTIEDSGADFLTVHGRTRDMFYTGEADWNAIYKIRNAVSIPVIGNGDIKNADMARELLESDDIDGIAIGRAAIGNPFLFAELSGTEYSSKYDVIKRHFEYMCKIKNERVAVNDFKKHLIKYLNNRPEAKKIRQELQNITNIEIMNEWIKSLFYFDKI